MYRVAKLTEGTSVLLGVEHKVDTSCYAVVDENGDVVKNQSGYEIYWRKTRAQQTANRYNAAESEGGKQ